VAWWALLLLCAAGSLIAVMLMCVAVLAGWQWNCNAVAQALFEVVQQCDAVAADGSQWYQHVLSLYVSNVRTMLPTSFPKKVFLEWPGRLQANLPNLAHTACAWDVNKLKFQSSQPRPCSHIGLGEGSM